MNENYASSYEDHYNITTGSTRLQSCVAIIGRRRSRCSTCSFTHQGECESLKSNRNRFSSLRNSLLQKNSTVIWLYVEFPILNVVVIVGYTLNVRFLTGP